MSDERLEQDDSTDSKAMGKGLLILLVLLCIGGGASYIYTKFSTYHDKEASTTKQVVKAVSNSESTIPGTKMLDALTLALTASGKYVKVGGWSCDKNIKDGGYDVWLSLTVNDNPVKLHWVVDANNNLHPANDLAQKVTAAQRLNL